MTGVQWALFGAPTAALVFGLAVFGIHKLLPRPQMPVRVQAQPKHRHSLAAE